MPPPVGMSPTACMSPTRGLPPWAVGFKVIPHPVSCISEVAQGKRAWLITRRLADRNRSSLGKRFGLTVGNLFAPLGEKERSQQLLRRKFRS